MTETIRTWKKNTFVNILEEKLGQDFNLLFFWFENITRTCRAL